MHKLYNHSQRPSTSLPFFFLPQEHGAPKVSIYDTSRISYISVKQAHINLSDYKQDNFLSKEP